ncbi:MAG: methylenetetrahydrofolate--tRNA-(uracil(54)-C(5))-methyltransferase (FADH(2)-oxidizing) TrmFO [Clostridiales bacterium]|nr:methylenetetrahydrofolate--tRNA-(uracil(54)-C(5))-methyltransferase (FADH(2)-oxidizing) TrmFO [Clostridiales bacterium]
MSKTAKINIIGAGLAGCEAAWQAVKLGVKVRLYEMKPEKYSPAHHSPGFAELVCSNSLRSNMMSNAIGVLKEEMKLLGSLIIEAAYATEVPAGSALAVDRELFSGYITEKLRNHPLVEIIEGEVTEIPDGITVVASGPLTSKALSESIGELIGGDYLHFFDAAAPIVSFDSIDMSKAFYASRYDKGEASYINCPFTKEEYDRFYSALITAEEAELKDFDKDEQLTVFEGCMPVEVMAKRGRDTLLFGPMKPVGITVPSTGKEAYAIVQLRQENERRTMYNIVGFQTHLKFPEQKRVFGLIPGLENAEFLRYGVMHRNTFMNSPKLLDSTYMLKSRPGLFFAGQMTGVEGYVESASSGLIAGLNAARLALGLEPVQFDSTSVIGSLACYISDIGVTNFQPMNANFGLVAMLDHKVKGGKRARNEALAARALEYVSARSTEINECGDRINEADT